MNKIYKLIWSQTANAFVAVSELATARDKSSSTTNNAALGAWVAVSEITKSKGKKSNKAIKSGVLVSSLVLFAGNAIAAPYAAGGGTATGIDAIAIGERSKALGILSMALGADSVAQGDISAAIGTGAEALGDESFAVGLKAKAIAKYSTALGNQSTAEKEFDLAVGHTAIASGGQSTAVGFISKSTGFASNAIGGESLAAGDFSTAVGHGAHATADSTLAAGQGAIASGEQSTAVGLDSKSTGFASNAIGGYSEAAGDFSTAVGSGARAEKTSDLAAGQGAFASGGQSTAVGFNSTSTGFASNAIGNSSLAKGNFSTAVGSEAHAEKEFDLAAGHNASASGGQSTAVGFNSTSTGFASNAIGNSSLAKGNFSTAVGSEAHAEKEFDLAAGHNAIASGGQSTAVGFNSKSTGFASNAIGNSSLAEGGFSTAVGSEAHAEKEFDLAAGHNANASGGQSTAVGFNSKSTGFASNAIGNSSLAEGGFSTAVGSEAHAEKEFDLAAGHNANASGGQSTAVGFNSKSTGFASNAIGNSSLAEGGFSTAVGSEARAEKASDLAVGFSAIASGGQSTAIGNNTIATGNSSVSIGTGAQATGKQSISVGTGNVVSGDNSGAFGDLSNISGNNSYSLGNNNTIATDNTFVVGSNVTKTLENSVFLGNNAAYTAKGASTDGIGAVTEPVTVGGTLAYGGFAGKTPVGVVSVGDVDKERRIQNVAAGLISATSTDAINGSQLYATNAKLGNVANTVVKNFGGNAALDADGNITYTNIGNTGKDNIHDAIQAATTKVEGDKGVTVSPSTNPDGSTTYTVAAKTDGVTTQVDSNGNIAAVTTGLTNTGTGTVATPTAPNALATAGDIANAINNAGFNLQANGDTKSLVKTGDTVQFLNGDNIKITRAGNDITVATAKNVTFDSVTAGPVVINSTGINAGNTQIKDVKAGTAGTDAVNVDQLTKAQAAATTKVAGDKGVTVSPSTNPDGSTTYTVAAKTDGVTTQVDSNGNIAAVTTGLTNTGTGTVATPTAPNALATAGDIANAINNAGFNLQANGDTKSLVKTGDTVQFLNGDNIKITRAGNDITVATAKNVTFDSVTAGPVVINSTGINAGNTQIKDVKAGTAGTDAVNVDQLTKAQAAATTKVAGDKGVTVSPSTNPDGSTTYTVAAKTDGVTTQVDSNGNIAAVTTGLTNTGTGTVATPTAPNALATAGDIANAINNAGFNLQANGDTKSLVKTGDTVQFLNGDNIKITRAGNDITVATAKNVTFDSVTAGPVVINSTGINAGNTQIKDVKAGTAGTDAVNVDQLTKAQAAATTKVAGDKGVTVSPSTNPDGSTTYTVAAKTDGVTTQVDSNGNIAAVTTGLTNTGTGTVATPTAPNALATAGDIANAINNAGFNLQANGDTKSLVKTGDTVQFLNGDNIKITRAGNDITVATAKNVTFDSVTAGPVVINSTGINAGNTQIKDVKAGTAGTDAVNVDQLKNQETTLSNKGLDFVANSGAKVHKNLGDTLGVIGTGTKADSEYSGDNIKTITDANGNIVVQLDKNLTTDSVTTNTVTLNGKPGVNGQPGTPGISITGAQGPAGVNGQPGGTTTRIEYNDGTGPQQIANLNDGLKFAGNQGATINKKLNETLSIKGDLANTDAATATNLRVDEENGELKVKLARNLKDLDSVTVGNNVLDGNGLTVGGPTGPSITNGGINAGNKTITNVAPGVNGTDAVNVSQLEKAQAAATTKVEEADGIKVVPTTNADGSTTYTVSAKTDGTTTKIDGNGNIAAVTTTFTPSTDGKVGAPVGNGDSLVTANTVADAINNSGWKATSGATGSGVVDGTTEELINPSETVTFQAGDNMVLNQAGNVFTYSLNKDININSVKFGDNGPTIKADANNNINIAKSDGSPTKITNVADGDVNANSTDAVNGSQLYAAQAAATTKVEGDKGVSVTPTTNADGSKTYTVAAKTDNTTVKVDDKGNIAAVTAPLTYTDGKVNTPAAPNALATAGDIANAINNSGWKLAADGTSGTELINPSDTVTFKTGSSNLTVKRDGANITYDLARNINVDSVQIGANGPKITNDGNNIKIGDKDGKATKITNVAPGVDATDAVNVSQLKDAQAAATTKVEGDKGVSVTPKTNADGSTTYTVAAKTDGTTTKIDDKGNIAAVTAPLTYTDGKVNTPAAPNALATAGDIANAINNSGWKLAADGTSGTELINPSDTVTFKTGSSNLTVKRDGANITYDLARNINVDSVQIGANGPKITNDGNNIKVGDKDGNATKITNVAPGVDATDAVNVSQLKAVEATANKGWNLTTNGKADSKSNVKPGDTVDFANTDGNVKIENTGNKVTVNLNKDIDLTKDGSVTIGDTKVNNDGLTIVGGPSVTKSGIDAGDKKITNVADGVISATSKDAVNGSQLYQAVNNINTSIAASKEEVKSADGSVTVTTTQNAKGANVYDLSVNTDGTTIKKNADGSLAVNTTPLTNNADGTVKTPTAPNAIATAGDIANAINNSGFTLTAKGSNGSLVKPGATVDMNNTDGNIVISKSASDNNVTYNLAKNVKVDSVTAGDTVMGTDGITINNGSANGNTVSLTKDGLNNGGNRITNVAPGVNGTDAVNVNQLQGLSNNINSRMDGIENNSNAGTAAAMAVAGLPQAYLPGKSMMAVAGGVYRGESGYAIGFSSISDGGNWVIKGTASGNSRGHYGATAGVGYQW